MAEQSVSGGKDRIRNPKTLVRGMVVRRHFGLPGKGHTPDYDDYEILGYAYKTGDGLRVMVRKLGRASGHSLNLGDMGIVPYPNGKYNPNVYTVVLRRP